MPDDLKKALAKALGKSPPQPKSGQHGRERSHPGEALGYEGREQSDDSLEEWEMLGDDDQYEACREDHVLEHARRRIPVNPPEPGYEITRYTVREAQRILATKLRHLGRTIARSPWSWECTRPRSHAG